MASEALDRSGARSSRWWVIGGVALLVGLTCAVYFPALQGQFILDDDALLTDNLLVKAPDGLFRMWFSREPVDYWPVANTTLWFEWRMWGMNPTGYHISNLLLHIAASLLLWAVLRKLAIPGAYLAALLFAVHPVNVESIAWIAQRKDALAVVFLLISIMCYLRDEDMSSTTEHERETAVEKPQGRPITVGLWYWLSFLTFVLAMLSKGSVAVLPGLLLLIVWWQHRRIAIADVLRTVPYFLVAIVLTVVNLWFQKHGAEIAVRDVSFMQRVLGAPAVVWFYLSKALVPIRLIFSYPQWEIAAGAWIWWMPLAAAAIITAMLARKYNSPQASWGRSLLFAWLFFGISLVPVLGLSDVGFMQYSLVADHYQHIALIAVVALFGAAWSAWYWRSRETGRILATICTTGVVGLLAFLTFQQCLLYAGPITLYEASLAQNPNSWFAHNNLGITLAKENRSPEAKAHFDAALRLNPDCALAHYNLGNLFRRANQFPEAIEEYQIALKLQPDFYDAHNNLGNTLLAGGRPKDAIDEFNEALKRRPHSFNARYNLGLAMFALGRLSDAITQFNRALQLRPDFAEAHANLGFALANVGRLPEAIKHLQEALRLQPNLAPAHRSLGFALAKSGKPEEAILQYQEAIKLDPDKPEDHFNLGDLLTNTGKFPDATKEFLRALELKPEFPEAESKLAVVLLNTGPPQDALEHCKRAIELRPNYTEAYANMALAYEQLHQREQAIAAAEKAIELARSQEQKQEAEQIEAWLKSYRGQKEKSESAAPQAS